MKYLPIILLIPFALTLSAQNIYHVNIAATGAGTGASWTDAFTDLQTALGIAGYGDQVWVAQGIYFPTYGTDRNRSFHLPLGVSLYGGFSGLETALEQRNIAANLTVLSGDIGEPGVQTDNSYHVVTIFGGDSLTILDGFTITRGQSGGSSDPFPLEFGGGLLVLADAVAPVASPVISNCRFEYNRANSGGGIACVANDPYRCIPEIQNCFFKRNRGEQYGGSIYKKGRNLDNKPFRLYNCIFEDNYCFSFAGGVAVTNPSGVVQFKKCQFIRDSSRLESGGIYVQTDDYNVRYEVDSCLFTANYSFISAGGFSHINMGYGADSVSLIVTNSRFFVNRTFTGSGTGVSTAIAGLLKYHYVLVQDSYFESNYTQNGGSGIHIQGSGGTVFDVNVDRCYFLGNAVNGTDGAGAFLYQSSSVNGDINRNTISNCVFAYNDGAIASFAGEPGVTDTRVVNCTFYRNNKIPFAKYWDPNFNTTDYYMKMQILNCVIWEPEVLGVHTLFFNNDPNNYTVNDYLVEHSMVQVSDCTYKGVNPCQEGMIYGQWPQFIDSTGIFFEVWQNSPAYNSGSNLVADTFGLTKDYDKNPRIANGRVDMGAYEILGPVMASDEPAGDARRLSIHLLQNPAPTGMGIQAEIFSVIPGEYAFLLARADGKILLEGSRFIPALTPVAVGFNSTQLTPGFYFILVRDRLGHTANAKVVVK